jgi:hypothetical protein
VKNPWIRYTLIRLGLFFGIFLIFALLIDNIYFAAFIAAAISFAISLLVLDRARDSLSEQVHDKLARGKDGRYADPESDFENQLLDDAPGETTPAEESTPAGEAAPAEESEREVNDGEAEPK